MVSHRDDFHLPCISYGVGGRSRALSGHASARSPAAPCRSSRPSILTSRRAVLNGPGQKTVRLFTLQGGSAAPRYEPRAASPQRVHRRMGEIGRKGSANRTLTSNYVPNQCMASTSRKPIQITIASDASQSNQRAGLIDMGAVSEATLRRDRTERKQRADVSLVRFRWAARSEIQLPARNRSRTRR